MSNIEVFDKYGRPFNIPRDQYRSAVLPAALRSNWDNPDALYGGIVQALADDFIEEATEAVERLHELEPGSARSITSLAYLRLRQKRVDEAHRLLDGYVAEHGPEATVLNNLAKVHAERNDHDQVERTLWRSLQADPNLENSLGWFEALHRERGGAAASVEAMRRVAELPNAWRARVLLARDFVDLDVLLVEHPLRVDVVRRLLFRDRAAEHPMAGHLLEQRALRIGLRRRGRWLQRERCCNENGGDGHRGEFYQRDERWAMRVRSGERRLGSAGRFESAARNLSPRSTWSTSPTR